MSDAPPPPVLLATDPSGLGSGAPRGWRVQESFALPDAPWDLASERRLVAARVESEPEARAALAAVTRGVGLLIWVGLDGTARQRFLEDLHKVAAPASHEVPTRDAGGLDDDHIALLDALAAGATVTEAAATLHVSRRTANRLLADIREFLGVDSRAEAVRRWTSGTEPGTAYRGGDERT